MKILLVMNPGSRGGRGRLLWNAWKEGLDRAGADYDCHVTSGLSDAFNAARTEGRHDTVVAVGGDGTINEVLDGVVSSGNARLRMGVLYAGTSPDFCRFHGIPLDPVAALAALLADAPRRADVARVNFGAGRERGISHFGCSSNIGLGAEVARTANLLRKRLGDTLGTGLALIRSMLSCRRVDLHLEIDGRPLDLPRTNNLTVAKNPLVASGLKLKLDLAPDDGKLFLIAIHGKGPGGMLSAIPSLYSGSITNAPGITVMEFRKADITSPQEVEVEYDGDPHGSLPVQIEVLPRALNLLGCVRE